MIGSTVTRYLSGLNYQITEINRVGIPVVSTNRALKFDVLNDDLNIVLAGLEPDTVLINLIGIIRHKIDESSESSTLKAKKINSIFPRYLVNQSKSLRFKVIQIATDCIYSGKSGNYSESSQADPIDFYGVSKLDGELAANNLLTLRVSVVGAELGTKIELLEWVLAHPMNSEIDGFINHIWNGITSLHFAKLVSGVIDQSPELVGTFHVVPADKVSKFELIDKITEFGARPDLIVREVAAKSTVDRTLSSEFAEINQKLWVNAGYSAVPTIRIMLEEYFKWISFSNQGEIST